MFSVKGCADSTGIRPAGYPQPLVMPMNNILKVILGSLGIFLLFSSGIVAYVLISVGFTINYLLMFIGFFLVGLLLFGLSTGAFSKPLLFLIPLSMVLSFFLIPDSVSGLKVESGALITLVIVLVVSYLVRKYYSIKEGKK